MSRAPRRGDVYWVILDPVVGTEIRRTRPAVVVSNDSHDRYGTRIVVLPITSNVDSLHPGEAKVEVKGKPGRATSPSKAHASGFGDRGRGRARLADVTGGPK